MARTMRANVFRDMVQFGIEEVPVPTPGPGEALIRVTLTTICGTDVHIVKGEYPVRSGLIIGHEPVGVIEALGVGVTGYLEPAGGFEPPTFHLQGGCSTAELRRQPAQLYPRPCKNSHACR
jgi:hypothetical protein